MWEGIIKDTYMVRYNNAEGGKTNNEAGLFIDYCNASVAAPKYRLANKTAEVQSSYF